MVRFTLIAWLVFTVSSVCTPAETPGLESNGYRLPNGWKITPQGKSLDTGDLVLNMILTPDGKFVVAINSGWHKHGVTLIDVKTESIVQEVPLPSTFYGLAWNNKENILYVSGGSNKRKNMAGEVLSAPIYAFRYQPGQLTLADDKTLKVDAPSEDIYFSGLAYLPEKNILYAASSAKHELLVFDIQSRQVIQSIRTGLTPQELLLTPDHKYLYVSNWGGDSISVIDIASSRVERMIPVGDNPSHMVLANNGCLYVACANDNAVYTIDTETNRTIEIIYTSLYENSPEGSTPNYIYLDNDSKTLYVANADNHNLCVVDIDEKGASRILGFIPTAWYPVSVLMNPERSKFYVGSGKGLTSGPNRDGPHSPVVRGPKGTMTTKSLIRGSVDIFDIPRSGSELRKLTAQAYNNSPYTDERLTESAKPVSETIVPHIVGQGSPIKHVIYIIKENRTYDQVFGDMAKGNGDPEICLFGEEITPNIHALADQFALLDNTYCDAEVSVDGHQWANAAYATDYIEKHWPASYGGHSHSPFSMAMRPKSGYLWDLCSQQGLTYRNYGEFARAHETGEMQPYHHSLNNLHGHVSPNYLSWGARDPENAKVFISEFDEYEKNYDNPDPEKRLPNLIILALPEDHTQGTREGVPTPRAAVASNDLALGTIIDRVSHSRYWSEMAVFVVQDDTQDGPDHVDAHRMPVQVISPYTKRGIVDSTFYTTCSVLRTIELLLGLPPMSQFDAAATPMYNCLGATPDLTPYTCRPARIDLNETNKRTAWGAKESKEMDFSEVDLTPMLALNHIVWKSIKGPDSEMPLPISRFRAAFYQEEMKNE